MCVINRLFLNIGSHVGESAEGLHSSCWAATKLPGEVHLVVSVMTTVTEVIKLFKLPQKQGFWCFVVLKYGFFI